MTPIVKYSHDRIGQRWTLKDHAKLLEYVHEQAKIITELRSARSGSAGESWSMRSDATMPNASAGAAQERAKGL